MFGNNPVRKQELDPRGGLYVSEVFHTIQGEGPLAGTPAIFVRLSGCNLQCEFCDTDFETVRQFKTVDELTHIIAAIQNAAGGNTKLVVITGGEPFIQNIVPLINRLYEWTFNIQIETAGTVTIDKFPWDKVTVVVSPKTGKVHEQFRLMSKDWKYILKPGNSNATDGLPVATNGRNIARPPQDATVWIQPMDEQDFALNERNQKACIQIALQHGYRISLQTHKILGVE